MGWLKALPIAMLTCAYALCAAQGAPDLTDLHRTLKAGTVAHKFAAIKTLADKADFTSLNFLLPLLTDENEQLAKEAAKVYLSILPREIKRLQEQVDRGSDISVVKERLSKIQAIITDPVHAKLIELDEFLLLALRSEGSPDPADRHRAINGLLEDEGGPTCWEVDQTGYRYERELCGKSVMPKFRVMQRLVSAEWRYALSVVGNGNSTLLEALAGVDRPEVTERFLQLLQSDDPEIRRASVDALSGRAIPESKLAPLARDRYAIVRLAVAHALSERETPEAFRILVALAEDRVQGVRRGAQQVLSQSCDPYVEWLAIEGSRSRDRQRSLYAAELLVCLDTVAATRELARISFEKGHPGRVEAIKYMVEKTPEKAASVVESAFKDSDPEVLVEACYAAGVLDLKRLLPQIEELTRSKNKDVADAAALIKKSLSS